MSAEQIQNKKKRKTNEGVKKSLVLGGLVGTAGFFISKAIGILYSVPFSSILGSSEYMSYYGTAYRIYSYILAIFTAGFPFAIATLVSKYETLKNWKTILYIKRMSVLFMICIGFLGMIVMMALSSILAPIVAESAGGAQTMMWVLCILAIAIFFVPILAAYRGFIQGMREVQEYAFSQAFEQLFRVGFLLSVACLLVYGMHMATVWALYAAVASTSVAAIAGLVQIIFFSRRVEDDIIEDARQQTSRPIPLKPLAREFILLAIPYMISAALGYSDDIYNAVLLPIGLRNAPYTTDQIDTVLSAVNYVGTKLTAIPMVLSPGFTAAIIPHISSNLVIKNYAGIRKSVRECLNIVLFIGMFLSFCIFLYAKPVFYVAFYTENLDLSAYIIQWCALEGFLGTVTPVISSIMMALGRQKALLQRLLVSCIIKGVLLVPFTSWWGFPGAVIATTLSYGYLIVMNCLELAFRYRVSFRSVFQIFIRTAIGLLLMGVCGYFLMKYGLGGTENVGRMVCLGLLCVNGLISVAVFAGVEWILQVPQTLFHLGSRKQA